MLNFGHGQKINYKFDVMGKARLTELTCETIEDTKLFGKVLPHEKQPAHWGFEPTQPMPIGLGSSDLLHEAVVSPLRFSVLSFCFVILVLLATDSECSQIRSSHIY